MAASLNGPPASLQWHCPKRMDDQNFKIIKLPRNGPKPGQSTKAWLYGKDKETEKVRKIIEWREFGGRKRK